MSRLLKGPRRSSCFDLAGFAEPLPPDATYRPLPTQPLDVVKSDREADKP
jgi:cytochrome c peroxidase